MRPLVGGGTDSLVRLRTTGRQPDRLARAAEGGSLLTWIKLDDNFPTNPKVLAAGDMAGWLYVCGLCYCGNALTDGFIPVAAVGRLTGLPEPDQLASALVDAGLWLEVDGGFSVHNYEKKQRTRAKIESDRSAAKVRANKSRSAAESRAKFARSHTEVTEPDTDSTSVVDNFADDWDRFGPVVATMKLESAQ